MKYVSMVDKEALKAKTLEAKARTIKAENKKICMRGPSRPRPSLEGTTSLKFVVKRVEKIKNLKLYEHKLVLEFEPKKSLIRSYLTTALSNPEHRHSE